jgi:hypothetical protein
MAGNIELALLTKVIDDKDFNSLEKLQITEVHFSTPEAQELYRFLRDTYRDPSTAGQIPSRELVAYRFPSFYFFGSSDPVPILAVQLKRERLRIDLLLLAQNLQMMADKDPNAAVAELTGEVGKFRGMIETSTDMSLSSAYDVLLNNYESVQKTGGMLGIPYPWDPLNDDTQGMQAGQFIVLYGRPGSMKSWLGIYMGIHAYVSSRRRVLFYTREMSQILVMQRAAAAIARVDYHSFTHGKLQLEFKEHVFNLLRGLIDDEKAAGTVGIRQPFFVVAHDKGNGGVGWLQSKIKELDPDLVIVDGMYLMKDDRSGTRTADWKSIMHISQDLKLTAQQFNLPLIAITQANRAGEKTSGADLTELAFSDAIGQDADAVYRIRKKDMVLEGGLKRTELLITSPKIREGKFDGIVIHGEPATDFGFIRPIIHSDNDNDDYNSSSNSNNSSSSNVSSGPTSSGQSFKKKTASFMDPRIPFKVR